MNVRAGVNAMMQDIMAVNMTTMLMMAMVPVVLVKRSLNRC